MPGSATGSGTAASPPRARGNGSSSATPKIATITAIRTRFATEIVKRFQFRYEPGWFRSMAAGACPARTRVSTIASRPAGNRLVQPLRRPPGTRSDVSHGRPGPRSFTSERSGIHRLASSRSALLGALAGAGDGADGRGHGQPQPDRHDHGREVAEGPDSDVFAGDSGEDHQQPRADEEGRAGRHDLEEIIHHAHLAFASSG